MRSAFAGPGTFAVASPATYSGGPEVIASPATYGQIIPASPVTYGDFGGKFRIKLFGKKVKGKAIKDIAAWALAPATGGASVLARYATRRGKKGKAILDVKRRRKATHYQRQASASQFLPPFARQVQQEGAAADAEATFNPSMAPEGVLDIEGGGMPVTTSSAPVSSTPWGLILGVGVGLLLIVGGMFAFTRRGRRSGGARPQPQRQAA